MRWAWIIFKIRVWDPIDISLHGRDIFAKKAGIHLQKKSTKKKFKEKEKEKPLANVIIENYPFF